MQSNPIENRLKDVEERIKINEEVMERLQILECKVEKMLAGNEGEMKDGVENLPDEMDQVLAGNEEEMKDGVESLPDETDQVYNDFPNFSLGIEFELSCGKKDVEDVASPSNEGRIELLEEVELKDDVWEKVVEVTAAIEAETEIEEGNVEIIDIDDETPDMHLKRQKKPGVLLQPPWVNEFDSTSGTKKCIVKGTFAFPVGVGSPMARDVDAFELWFNKRLVKKNNGNCGIYAIKYVHYFINGMLNETSKSFNIPHLRRNLVAQLYAYEKKKQEEEYDTDNECVSNEME
ncbi:Hypothetical predicted protein [Olea europaea subsp. europaea]|uniref:Ubiquitin-like protease family profile domain-containing protein n=1 Tax=Olea europaea subsp. europaea TaxID=158383 RepID=A0A8S0RC26_OLEEU|nr:Hypothetical predicted protein [Olea europaea subsp. europaea]